MTFEFLRIRFRFRAMDLLCFAPGKTGNILRGAFGLALRRLACVPECGGAPVCARGGACAYARLFEPGAVLGPGPSGLANWPRPFVFRSAHLDGRRIEPGEVFHFDVHFFDLRQPGLTYFALAFANLASEGLGPGRGRSDLLAVEQLRLDDSVAAQFYEGATFRCERRQLEPATLDLARQTPAVSRVGLRFVTPTELKVSEAVAARPEFPAVFKRLRDRISTLRALYGRGPLDIDFRGMGERAARVQLVRSDLRWIQNERRSSRTGQVHPLGGFTGEAEYAGDLGEFLPYLQTGRWVGVGRQTVWGKGEVHVLAR